jgi:elongation factor Ts
MITTEEIKILRDETGLSIMQCKKALEEADGDRAKAIILLKEKGADIRAKKGDRNLGAGAIISYVHASGTIGVLLELLCETDFVAKNPEFKEIGHNIAMQIAAMKPENTEELLAQPFIKEPSQTINDLLSGAVQKFGERTEVGKFTRFSIE